MNLFESAIGTLGNRIRNLRNYGDEPFFVNEESDLRSIIREELEDHPLMRRLAGRRIARRGMARAAFRNRFAGEGSDEYGYDEDTVRSMIREELEEHPVLRRQTGRRLLRKGITRSVLRNRFAEGGALSDEDTIRSMIREELEEHPIARRMIGRRLVRRGVARAVIRNKIAEQLREGEYGLAERPFFQNLPKGWKRPDDKIKDDACEALAMDEDVDASEIEVKVQNGIITLTGEVDDRWTKRAAEECVEDVFGVQDVHNELSVNKGPIQSQAGKGQKETAQHNATLS